MLRVSRFVRLLFAALVLSFAAGSAMAAVQCAAPMAMPAGCPDQHQTHDCAVACAPMCATVKPMPAKLILPSPMRPQFIAFATGTLATRHIGPEPPPPRAS